MIIIASPRAQLALDTLEFKPSLSINAEYGAYVAEGTLYTSANHQPEGSPYTSRFIDPQHGRPAPCNDPKIPQLGELQVALIKTLSPATIGGLLRADGYDLSEKQDFWNLVEVHDLYPDEPDIKNHPQYTDLNELVSWLDEHTPQQSGQQNQDLTDFFYLRLIPYLTDFFSRGL